jgi:multidrug efflux pump subunit AcrA (membrane-fusion protein)
MKKVRKRCTIYFLLFSFLLAFQISPLHADESDMNETTETGKTTNIAQDQHAQNLAEIAALHDPKVTSLNEYLAYAEQELNKAILSNDQQRIDAAQKAYDSAKANYEDALAKEITATREEIATMRKQGVGWGEIAHKFGVHPGVLGLGHAKKALRSENMNQEREQKETTSQGVSGKAGKSKGFGFGQTGASSGKGKGQGNAGGHGGGHGGGKGGGHK